MTTKTLHFNFRQQPYLFRFRLGFTLLCVFLFFLCCILSAWQLHRYTQKKIVLDQFHQHLTLAPILLTQLSNPNELQFQQVKLKGLYLNSLIMLVQNRFYKDQLGFEVLTPLYIPGQDKLMLIDRGWIQKNKKLPEIPPVNDEQTIAGYIKLLNEYQFILGDNIIEPNKSPLIMQRIDINELSKITHQSFYPFILRLNANQPHGFVRDWTITTVPLARHMAYAIQWFALALVLFVAYFCFCCERVVGVSQIG